MNLFKKPLRRRERGFQAALFLEGLETRLAPANVFVVPLSHPVDGGHVHSLTDAVQGAGPGGLVTIEPGATAETAEVSITQDAITIQGDPNVPAGILPIYELAITASHVQLTKLNLQSAHFVSPVTAMGNTLSKCLVYELLVGRNVGTIVTQNTITGFIDIDECMGVRLSENIVNSVSQSHQLTITNSDGTVITNNTFFDHGGNVISLEETLGRTPTRIANNSISAAGGMGIMVQQDPTHLANLEIVNNTLDNGGENTGLSLNIVTGGIQSYRILVQGNDFHNTAVGVLITGQAIGAFIDLGGGLHGSLGGNDFRGFTVSRPAIDDEVGGGNPISARQNIFSSGVVPASVVVASSGDIIDVAASLSDERAFVQTLYNQTLGRSGTLAELDPWVSLLAAQGQAAVVNGIAKSAEALGRVVDQLYLRFLGRESDAGGRSGWIGFLQGGGTLEAVESLFLTSPEYISHINTDFVQSLYLNILGRPGSPGELSQWNNNFQAAGGLTGIANAFVHSTENRLNTLRSDFQKLLHRTPTNTELTPLVNTSLDLLALQRLVLSSPEFFANG